jgi:hypothetical protein
MDDDFNHLPWLIAIGCMAIVAFAAHLAQMALGIQY